MRSSRARLDTPDAEHPLPVATRLTRQHFALYRGYLDGVSEAQLHASYGDASADIRSTRRLIAVLRDTLSVLARRAQDTDAAYLLRLRPGSIPPLAATPAQTAPSLDEFRDRVDPESVFGEAELLALYEEAFSREASPALDRRAARNARLRRRQAEALARMEANLAQDPRPEHPVDGWLEPALAARLSAAGLATIGELIAFIESKRHRWYTRVPRLGPKGAQRVVDWLRLHAPALRHELSERALVPRRQWDTAVARPPDGDLGRLPVAPLEALRVPPALDGSKGANRAERFSADIPQTDVQAIAAWLDARAGSAHTRRAYRREAERLLLWALIEKGKPLSSLDPADCAEYIGDFLVDPQPAGRWVQGARVERCLAAWRPFAGPLSDRSRETARAILGALCAWLVESGYLLTNPFVGLERASAPPAFESAGRVLDLEQWKWVLESTARETYSFVEHRDRLALLLAYATGLRRSELADATTGALSVGRIPGVDVPVWRLAIGNQAAPARSVLLPPIVADALFENLTIRGFRDPLSCPHDTPLLAQARGGRALSADAVGRIIKQIFASAAEGSTERRASLARASTHWLRHTHSVHALGFGVDLRELNAELGHASLATTALYTAHEDAGRFLGLETLIRALSGARKVY